MIKQSNTYVKELDLTLKSLHSDAIKSLESTFGELKDIVPNAITYAEIVLLLLTVQSDKLAEEMKNIGVGNGIIMSISVAKSTLKGDIVRSDEEK